MESTNILGKEVVSPRDTEYDFLLERFLVYRKKVYLWQEEGASLLNIQEVLLVLKELKEELFY